VTEPDILLLDEPFGALDQALREHMQVELRKLQQSLATTALVVTHDQHEALMLSDLIAVMNAGRIDQLGTPEDIYDRPQSEFVARFIGAANIIKGVARDANHVAFAGVTLQVVGTRLAAGDTAAVAVRQHDIALSARAPQNLHNVIPARVTRQVFLGATRDYLVEAADGTQLRVVTAPDNLVAEGTEVWLSLPPERCRALAR